MRECLPVDLRQFLEFPRDRSRRSITEMDTPADIVPTDIVARIVNVRGQRVLLDSDLAEVYGVTTARLNQQVNRNLQRFPGDFIFTHESQDLCGLELTEELASLRGCSPNRGDHGRNGSQQSSRGADERVRRSRVGWNSLERSVAALDTDTRKKFDQVYEAILGLMGSQSRRN